MMSSRELSPPDHDNRHHHPHPIRRRDHHHHKYSTYQNYPMNYSDREQCDGYVTPKRKARSLSRPVHPPLNQQVEELHNSLHETDDVMTENERMLADYRLASTRQSREMDGLRSELNRSREILSSSKCHTPRLSHSCCGQSQHSACSVEGRGCGRVCGHDHEQLLSELHKEKQAREMEKLNSAQVLTLLDTSLRTQTPAPSVTNEDIKEEVTEQIKDLTDSHKKLENNNEVYELRLKEVEEKLNEGSMLSKTEGAFEELTQQVSQLKHDLWQREASEKRRKMLQQIKLLENDLSTERQQHSTSVRQSHKLFSQVKQLGKELDQVVHEKEQAMSCLEATSQQLNKSLGGREELLQKIGDLQHSLTNSESQRIQCVEKCGQLSKECFNQEVCQETLRKRIKDVESKVQIYKQERSSLESHQQVLVQELSEKTLSECCLYDQCLLLQQQIAEQEAALVSREAELEGVVRKLECSEKQCNEGRMEMVQLRADFKNTENQKNSLDSKIQALEDSLYETHNEFEKLRLELKEVSDQLSKCLQEKTHLQSQVVEEKRKYEQLSSQKKALQSRISKLEHQLEESEKRQKSSYSQALQAVKKFKNRAHQTAQEKLHVEEERDSVIAQNTDLKKQLLENQNILKTGKCRLSQLEQEIMDLHAKVTTVQNLCDEFENKNENLHHQVIDLEATCDEEKSSLEKCRHELTQCHHDNENFQEEIAVLKQNLERSMEQAQAAEKRLTVELTHAREFSESQIAQLKSEIEICRTDNSKFAVKHKKVLSAYQSLKNEFEAHRLQENHISEEKSKLEKHLEEMQKDIMRKEKGFLERAETWKTLQSQELKKLKQKHSHVTLSLQETVASLESKLADEQISLCDVRRQQLKILDDQQKVYADDLSKSIEDTERVRHKYLKAKKNYEEKAALLEGELSSFSGENQSLRQRLTESQTSLLQQVEEHESILRTAAKEVDTIVHQMGLRVDVPMFPIIVGDESDIKKWMADMIAKLKWLQKEVTDLLKEESKLRHRVKSEHKNDAALDSSSNSTI